jgi:hypothetical protein
MEVHIDNEWMAASVTELVGKTIDNEWMVVFRNSEGAKDIVNYQHKNAALEKYQYLVDKHFINYPFQEKAKAEGY